MKKVICLLLSLVMITGGVLPLSLSSFAKDLDVGDECPTAQELLTFTKFAWEYQVFLEEGIYSYWRDYNSGKSDDFIEWLISKGFMPETLEIKTAGELPLPVDRHTGESYEMGSLYPSYPIIPFYALPEGITLEMLKEEYYKLFYYDNNYIFDCAGDHPVYGQPGGRKCFDNHIRMDDSGRVYMDAPAVLMNHDEYEWDFWKDKGVWESAKIVFKDSQKIILTVMPSSMLGLIFTKPVAIEYRNTPNGWRVYDRVYDVDLPETGDNTPIFVALIALPTIGLGMLAVKTWKKRKKQI